MAIKRIKTGIKGFDRLVQGGLPKNSSTLISGTPGTGKTIFATEFLYNGASRFNERGLYITFEQEADAVRIQAEMFGWNLKKLEKEGKLIIRHFPIKEIDQDTIKEINSLIKTKKIKRLVIDSLSTLSINAPIYAPVKDLSLVDIMKHKAFFSPPIMGDFVVKRFIYAFVDDLREMGCTSVLISEKATEDGALTRDSISEFICDGVILINYESMGGAFSRSMQIRKMRHTANDEDIHPLQISEKGIIVHDLEEK